MKLYFKINDDDQFSFDNFIKTKELLSVGMDSLPDLRGLIDRLYVMDTTEKTVEYVHDHSIVANSFKLKWDYKYAEDLLEDRVIGRFNQDKLKWTLMNAKAMEPLIRVLMYGMDKYDRDNWMKACPDRLDLMDSLERHSKQIISGESVDVESGLPHIGHLMANAMFYSYWEAMTEGQFENFTETK